MFALALDLSLSQSSPPAAEGGGGAPEALAIIDFANATYSIGATSKTLRDMLPDETLLEAAISGANGWFPQTDQYSVFGSALLPVIGDSDGVVLIIDAEYVSSSADALILSLGDGIRTALCQWSPSEATDLVLTGYTGVATLGIASVTGRKKIGVKLSPSEFALDATGATTQTDVPNSGFDPLTVEGSYVEAGSPDGPFKVYSIKFYAPNADIAALVVA